MAYRIIIQGVGTALPEPSGLGYRVHYEDREGNVVIVDSSEICFAEATGQFFRASIAQVEKRFRGQPVWVQYTLQNGEVWQGSLESLLREMSEAEQEVMAGEGS